MKRVLKFPKSMAHRMGDDSWSLAGLLKEGNDDDDQEDDDDDDD